MGMPGVPNKLIGRTALIHRKYKYKRITKNEKDEEK